jgi:hypothetical protein
MKWAVLLIFGTIGLAALIGGTKWGLESYPISRNYVSAQGTVVEYAMEKNDKKNTIMYYPVVEFLTASNAKVRFRSTEGSDGTPAYETGATVDVMYDLRSPSNARIGSIKELWTAPIMAGGVGMVLLLLSIVLFVKIGSFEKHLKSMGPLKKGDRA